MKDTYLEEEKKALSPSLAMEEASRCLLCYDAPCSKNCPAGTDPGKFIRSLRFKNIEGAASTIRINNALGSICARVCPTERYCQKGCLHAGLDRPIDIGGLQRFITDYEEKAHLSFLKAKPTNHKKVAIVGSGPSALEASATLRTLGYGVTIYEKQNKLGGALRYGIPEYRLPTSVLNNEIQRIIDLGVEVKLNCNVGEDISVDELKNKNDAVLICCGYSQAKSLPLFKDNPYTVLALDLLAKMKECPLAFKPKDNYLVIGGGDVTMDVIASLKKLGAKRIVDVVYEEINEVKASKAELATGLPNASSVAFGYIPVEVKDNVVKFKHRFLESELSVKADQIVLAVGQAPDITGLPLALEKGEAISNFHATNDPKIFVAGDIAPKGEKSVVYGVRSGKEAALVIDNILGGKK
jgi:dihydropyrimidine dehydrogenase (NAD+) subunit PreT